MLRETSVSEYAVPFVLLLLNSGAEADKLPFVAAAISTEEA